MILREASQRGCAQLALVSTSIEQGVALPFDSAALMSILSTAPCTTEGR
jgi:hypothetical protein